MAMDTMRPSAGPQAAFRFYLLYHDARLNFSHEAEPCWTHWSAHLFAALASRRAFM